MFTVPFNMTFCELKNSLFLLVPPPQEFFRVILGEYEQRAVYKRYNVVDNVPDCVLKSSGAIHRTNYGVFYGRDEHILFAHTRILPVIVTLIKHTYLVRGTPG